MTHCPPDNPKMTRKQAVGLGCVVAATFVAYILAVWLTLSFGSANASMEDMDIKQRLRWIDRDAMKLEDRLNDLEQRVKILEGKP